MENLISFQNALLRISAFVWAAVIVLSAFLAYEVLWRRKHPQVAAGRADEAEKKACARRLSLVFCFLFVWLAVFVFFLLRLTGASVCAYWGLLPVFLGGVWLSLSLRK
jgi:protein-S-isoprenylcysteine O-methyltransferase Ste14